jgi:hypothetical protein
MKKSFRLIFLASFLISACQLTRATPTLELSTVIPLPTATWTPIPPELPVDTATPVPLVPNFSHIVVIIFENKEYGTVVGSPLMPYFNLLAGSFTLLNQHYATTHPSLPNYISLIGGDTFGITDNCEFANCSINAPSLPDLIEESGRTWKTYQCRTM